MRDAKQAVACRIQQPRVMLGAFFESLGPGAEYWSRCSMQYEAVNHSARCVGSVVWSRTRLYFLPFGTLVSVVIVDLRICRRAEARLASFGTLSNITSPPGQTMSGHLD